MSTKVFISWGGQLSKNLANSLRNWLPSALQFVKPYFSPDDIQKGAKCNSAIANELQNSHIGIICLTRDNTERPWIVFEAGALSKIIDKREGVHVVIFDVEPSDIKGPLASFQGTVFRKDEFKLLISTINKAGGESALEAHIRDSVFEMWWPKLEEEISSILSNHDTEILSAHRSDREILGEILQLSRMTAEGVVTPRVSRQAIQELLFGIKPAVFLRVWKVQMEQTLRLISLRGRCGISVEKPIR